MAANVKMRYDAGIGTERLVALPDAKVRYIVGHRVLLFTHRDYSELIRHAENDWTVFDANDPIAVDIDYTNPKEAEIAISARQDELANADELADTQVVTKRNAFSSITSSKNEEDSASI